MEKVSFSRSKTRLQFRAVKILRQNANSHKLERIELWTKHFKNFGHFGRHFPRATSAKIYVACTRCAARDGAICSKNRKIVRWTNRMRFSVVCTLINNEYASSQLSKCCGLTWRSQVSSQHCQGSEPACVDILFAYSPYGLEESVCDFCKAACSLTR